MVSLLQSHVTKPKLNNQSNCSFRLSREWDSQIHVSEVTCLMRPLPSPEKASLPKTVQPFTFLVPPSVCLQKPPILHTEGISVLFQVLDGTLPDSGLLRKAS